MWTWIHSLVDAFLGKVPGKPGRLDTATRMAMDADFSDRREPAMPVREPTPKVKQLEELERILKGGPKEVSPDQCQQAREVLKWTRAELAQAAGVMLPVVAAFEDGRAVSPAHETAIRAALEAVGIGFPFEIAGGQARPAGVTYSPPDRKSAHQRSEAHELFEPLRAPVPFLSARKQVFGPSQGASCRVRRPIDPATALANAKAVKLRSNPLERHSAFAHFH